LKRLIRAGAACGLLILASCSATHSDDPASPISKLTKAMLVEPSSLPKVEGGEWQVGKIRSEDSPPRADKYVPAECAPLVGDVDHTQRVSIRMMPIEVLSMPVINFWLYVTPDPPDAKELVPKCGSVSERYLMDKPGNRPFIMTPTDVPGVPPWAAAANMNDSIYVMGSYRGVFFRADFNPEHTDVAMQVFNQQAAKLAGV